MKEVAGWDLKKENEGDVMQVLFLWLHVDSNRAALSQIERERRVLQAFTDSGPNSSPECEDKH